jgi:hypothetical protein
MKSTKRIPKPSKFRPFSNPTMKVREAWSRFASTLSASSFAGAYVIASNEMYSTQAALRMVGLLTFGVLLQLIAVYVLRGNDHAI